MMTNFTIEKWPKILKIRIRIFFFLLSSLTSLSVQAQCSAANVPYVLDFESAIIPGIPFCTSTENVGSGNDWITYSDTWFNYNGYGFMGKFLRYRSSEYVANAWFYTQGINMVANTPYKISYEYGGTIMSGNFTEKLKVACGTNASAAGMTTILVDHPNITQQAITTNALTFTPTTSGVYYFGFNAYSGANNSNLHVDNIKIKVQVQPVITSFTPVTSCGQSTLLTINGTGLEDATVTIGGTNITLATNTDQQITANISTAMTGAIVVTTIGGTATSATNFTYAVAPALSLSDTSTFICEGVPSSAVTVVNGAADYTVYAWTPATGVSGNATSGWFFNPAVETNYVLNASNPTTGCVNNNAGYSVEIIPWPAAITTTAETIEVCQNATSAIVTAASELVLVERNRTVYFGSNLELPGSEDVYSGMLSTLDLSATVTLPPGAVVTSTKLIFSDVTVANGDWGADLNATLSGAITLDRVPISNVQGAITHAGPYEIVTENIPNTGGDIILTIGNYNNYNVLRTATIGDVRLVVEYTIPGSLSMTWWNAAVGGTQIGTGTTLETVGTSVLPTTATSGTYTVYAQASNGECARLERKAINVIVNPNAVPVITASSLVICDGSSVVLTSSAATGNLWSTAETTNTISVSEAGSYTVTITNSGCTAATSVPVVVTSGTAPVAVAALTGNVTITATPAGQTYQWVNCTTNVPVAGATNATFTATVNGLYKVIVTNADGCKDTSACVNISKAGVEENNIDLGVTLYPNPTEDKVFVEMTETETADLTVFDVQGKTILTMDNIQNGSVINLNHAQNGIYMVKISNEKGANIYRVSKN